MDKKNVSSQIEKVIVTFSLSVSQVARIMAVSRAEIHSWMSMDLTPDPSVHRRLMAVYELALLWESYGRGSMGDLSLVPCGPDGKSVVGYLCESPLDEDGMLQARERIEKAGRLRAMGTGWREAFARMGFAGPTPEQQDGIQEDNLNRIWRE